MKVIINLFKCHPKRRINQATDIKQHHTPIHQQDDNYVLLTALTRGLKRPIKK